jgi:hypothetical protein
MKFAVISVLVSILATFAAAAEHKAILVSYPDGTPDRVLAAAKDEIRKAVCLPTMTVLRTCRDCH